MKKENTIKAGLLSALLTTAAGCDATFPPEEVTCYYDKDKNTVTITGAIHDKTIAKSDDLLPNKNGFTLYSDSIVNSTHGPDYDSISVNLKDQKCTAESYNGLLSYHISLEN